MINLVAITVDTVWVESVILILVTSTYRRIVCKMFFLSLRDNSDYVTVITLDVLIFLSPITLPVLNFRFEDFAFFYCLFCSLTLNHRIKFILPVLWFSPALPVTNGILILACVVLVAENNRSAIGDLVATQWRKRKELY